MKTLILFAGVVGAIIISFLLWGNELDAWVLAQIKANESRRLLVAVILFLVLALDIMLPVPSSVVSTLCGLYFGIVNGFLISFLAMNVSAGAGYALGCWCSSAAERFAGKKEIETLRRIQQRGGAWLLLSLRPVPVLAEASVVFAGMGKYPVKGATAQILVGNAVVSAIYAVVGATSRNSDNAFLYSFIGVMLISAVFYLLGKNKWYNETSVGNKKGED